ncbi:MAG TPA: 3-deoxy-7-phosphoheptulonate synthase [Bacteroidetes bacterium]|jgi:3-deoxy-7-phosphoheptulonate synthase|nr:3-deoxy-7-phosphoheptulonate synthase [Flavobacteriaceae bacterium]HBN03206.1 3-deoxy-7-phosphoheptulonate synthase [Bacteroidota bacterium]|tara:strand:+ start:1444 stop:2292 length:849 start_codon:yes stop_codon:yes gene_type:complete
MSDLKLVSKQYEGHKSEISIGQETIGGTELCLIAGPCAVESEEQLFAIAKGVSDLGIKYMRGGAYKPRTSPYAFQGLGKQGLQLLKKASELYNLKIVTEVMDTSLIEEVYDYADILQVGSRNAKNYTFLKELGKIDKPILLKRGMSSTINEWLLAAEYIMLGGNENVILCERGIRTFDTSVRNTMDLAAIPLVKELSHLPVIADPSQGTGKRSLVIPMSLAAIAAGADGVMLEVHNDPEEALSDGFQSLYLDSMAELITSLKRQAQASGRTFNLKSLVKETV